MVEQADRSIFGKHERRDGKPGYMVVTPTTMRYVEADGSDVRVERVRVYNQHWDLERVYLRDTLGVRFVDLPDVADDLGYLAE